MFKLKSKGLLISSTIIVVFDTHCLLSIYLFVEHEELQIPKSIKSSLLEHVKH